MEALTTNKFVTFRLENELFGLDVFRTREILEVPEITMVPGMPSMIRGVVNLRGDVVPVIDLKLQFGNQRTEFLQDTIIIVTEINNDGEILSIGILADSAQEVVTLDSDQIEPPPKMNAFNENNYIAGMGKMDKGFILILNINEVLSDDALSSINNISAKKDV